MQTRLSHSLNYLLLGAAVCLVCLTGCDSIGTDSSRFLDPSSVIKASEKPYTRVIEDSMDPAEERWSPEYYPNSTLPTAADLMFKVEDYVIGPNDIMDISVLDLFEPGVETVLRRQVSNSGYIDLPLVERVKAEGLTKDQLRQAIMTAYAAGVMQHPTVSITILQERQNTFNILGAVARPGQYNILKKDMRVTDALAVCGGFVQTGIQTMYVIRPAAATKIDAPELSTPAVTPAAMPTLPGLSPTSLPATPTGTTPVAPPASGTGSSTSPTDIDNEAVIKAWTSELNKKTATQPSDSNMPKPSVLPRLGVNSGPDGAGAATSPTAEDTSMPAPENVKWVFSNGRWVAVSPAGPQSQPSKANDKLATSAPSDKSTDPFGFRSIDKSDTSRIIAIDLKALQQGNQLKDIVIRNNDIIQIPPLEAGEFYVMGEVQRPGVYSIQGRKITAKMAIAAAGNFGPLSYPPNSILIRRIGKNQEQIFPLNMEKIFRGEENDIFLKPDDVLAVGQNVLSPFLIVLRNAFRLTYGFGFIYDRNFADALVPGYEYNSKRFTNW